MQFESLNEHQKYLEKNDGIWIFFVIEKLPARTITRKIICEKSDANNKNLINK
jgi:hypothetical protein